VFFEDIALVQRSLFVVNRTSLAADFLKYERTSPGFVLCHYLRQAKEIRYHFGIVRSSCKSLALIKSKCNPELTQTSNRIPPGNSRKSFGSTARIRSIGNIIQHGGICVQSRIHKSNGVLSSIQSLLIDTTDDSCEDWGGSTSSTRFCKLSAEVDSDVIALEISS
jgi:hypothetical protein